MAEEDWSPSCSSLSSARKPSSSCFKMQRDLVYITKPVLVQYWTKGAIKWMLTHHAAYSNVVLVCLEYIISFP